MTRLYRLARKRYCQKPLDGEGSFRFGGRWSSPGVRVVYAAEHSSLAMLEYLVHIDSNLVPHDLMLITLEAPDTVSRMRIPMATLPKNWRQSPAPARLASIGDTWIHQNKQMALIVPSALAPIESNWLLNPAHPHFPQLTAVSVERFVYDPRVFSR